MYQGEEVHGELHSTDASGGLEVPLYEAGRTDVRTLLSSEILVITDAEIISVPGGDVSLFLDANDDNTLDAGETVLRGTVAANGGIARSFVGTPRFGVEGAKPHIIAPAGVVDVLFTGFIKKA